MARSISDRPRGKEPVLFSRRLELNGVDGRLNPCVGEALCCDGLQFAYNELLHLTLRC